MKVICTNNKNKPNEIPDSKWLKEGEEYTVIETCKCNTQGGIFGFKLAEIDLYGCEPYRYFAANRFELVVDAVDKLEEELVELA